jgi:hypothetical protein
MPMMKVGQAVTQQIRMYAVPAASPVRPATEEDDALDRELDFDEVEDDVPGAAGSRHGAGTCFAWRLCDALMQYSAWKRQVDPVGGQRMLCFMHVSKRMWMCMHRS